MRSRLSPSIFFHIITRAPDLLPKVTRFLLRKKFDADRDVRRGDGRASRPPYMVSLRITNACNHRCPVCGQYGAFGYMDGPEKRKELLKTLPVETYKKMVDDLAFYRPFYYATGGEPFLYPGIVELMNYAKAREAASSSSRTASSSKSMRRRWSETIGTSWWSPSMDRRKSTMHAGEPTAHIEQ